MSRVNQFIDFSLGTGGDTGANDPTALLPIINGESMAGAPASPGYGGVFNRPAENLRQRTEALRTIFADTLYVRDADRAMLLGGPGKVTWPGSTTASASGIPVVTDTLWLIPALTPGFAQTPPLPPVASVYGTLTLNDASSSLGTASITVTSLRRNYEGGDTINVTVVPGSVFGIVLSDTPVRTIVITATGATTLTMVVNALNLLTVSEYIGGVLAAHPLISAALIGGHSGSDLFNTAQDKRYILGNYDGEGHTLTPAAVAAFFAANPTSALAEGDTLCIQYTEMMDDSAGQGGRRQSIVENSNTAIPFGSYFNSRLHPEKLVNALPICKVLNGRLVFVNGVQVPAGVTAYDLFGSNGASITYAGGPTWADGVTNPATTVEAQLDKIVSDLAASGAIKITYGGGAAWLDAVANPSASVEAQLDKVITDLSSQVSTTSGADKIGVPTKVYGFATRSAESLYTRLNAIEVAKPNLATINTFAQIQTFSVKPTAPDYSLTAARSITRKAFGVQVGADWSYAVGGLVPAHATASNPDGLFLDVPMEVGWTVSVSVKLQHSVATLHAIEVDWLYDGGTHGVVQSAALTSVQNLPMGPISGISAGDTSWLYIFAAATGAMTRDIFSYTLTYTRA